MIKHIGKMLRAKNKDKQHKTIEWDEEMAERTWGKSSRQKEIKGIKGTCDTCMGCFKLDARIRAPFSCQLYRDVNKK